MRKYRILHFSEGWKNRFEASTSAIGRARRVLSGAIIVRVGASHLANRLVKYWVLGVFGVVFCIFQRVGRIILKHRLVQSIELVEFYQEPSLVDLEPVFWRIGWSNTEFWGIWGRILHFSERRKDSFETPTSPIDRARRVLSGAMIARLGASLLANRLVKYWVLGVFGVVFGIFGAQRRVLLKHRPVQSIELVELYLEPWLSDLEPVVWRIGSD